ncbi:MAG: hypothetical protein JXR96_22085 [Deltaproteobacteria bacterium]|nr:hypothetical protein [Deltaproteobacteria bacterium]
MRRLGLDLAALAIASTLGACAVGASPKAGSVETRTGAFASRRQAACAAVAPGPKAGGDRARDLAVPQDLLPVRGLAVRGNRRLSSRRLLGGLRTAVGGRPDPRVLADDMRHIWALGGIDDLHVEQDPDGTLCFVIHELPVVDMVFAGGARGLEGDELRMLLDLRPGSPWSRAASRKLRRQVLDKLRARGHLRASVELRSREPEDGKVDVCAVVDEGPVYRVRRLDFPGAREMTPAELSACLGLRPGETNAPGGIYDPGADYSMLGLQACLYERGFVQAQILDPQVEIDDSAARVDIRLGIEEGGVYTLGEIAFSGELIESQEAYRAVLRSQSGQVFKRSQIGQDIERLRRFHENRGRFDIDVEPVVSVDAASRRISVTFDIRRRKAFERRD